MNQLLLIAASEWRYWLQSRLALGGALIFLLLFVVTSLLSALRMEAENHSRGHQQTEAENTFLSQPDRHPHRMVHYGHYLFRTPAPLATFDPGLDTVTGQSIFLEGHRQNTVMFAESAASADFGGLSWLSPALVYQLFAPLIIILLGYGSIAREREAAVLAPLLAIGISGRKLIAGKALALQSFVLLLLCPLVSSCALAMGEGESPVALLLLFGLYFVYLTLWLGLTLLASTLLTKRSTVLLTMIGLWLGFTLVLPSIAVNSSSSANVAAGKIESDLTMLADLRKLGDGHNANDPAFKKLRSDLLKKYGVERIEDLPVNYRGIVALSAEKKLTNVLNDYADARMAAELQQEHQLENYGWFTPALAIALASRSIAGTDLAHYHHFQREAENVRFSFVQGLNRAHAESLSYLDDINRSKDEESWQRARVDASHWQVLEKYQFQTTDISKRVASASTSIQKLIIWMLITFVILLWRSGKISL
ncbi:ABC transporter permease [Pseudoteredinibacter isoporae]|uniref:ABC transporter permease n=1 Tax=Pseudoteredinibacter isoporae TaxID=570281 RepID=UPI003341A890